MDKLIEISTNLTAEDLKRIGFRRIRTKLIVTGVVLIIFVLFLVLGLILSFLSKRNNIPLVSLTPLLIPIGIFSFSFFLLIWAVNKQAKTAAQNIEQTNYTFSEQGMDAESSSTSVKTLWSNFLKVEESDSDFLLFTHRNIAIPIPKHFLLAIYS